MYSHDTREKKPCTFVAYVLRKYIPLREGYERRRRFSVVKVARFAVFFLLFVMLALLWLLLMFNTDCKEAKSGGGRS